MLNAKTFLIVQLGMAASRMGACRAFVAVGGRRSTGTSSPDTALFSTTNNSNNSNNILSSPSVVLDRVFNDDERPIILFDGICNLCNTAVNLALDWDPRGQLRFAALQSNVGRALLQSHGRAADDISSIVFVTKNGAYTKSDAVLGITEELNPLPFLPLKPFAKIATNIVPQFLRDLIYDGVADNRYALLGTRDECRFDADGEFDDRFVDDSLAEAR